MYYLKNKLPPRSKPSNPVNLSQHFQPSQSQKAIALHCETSDLVHGSEPSEPATLHPQTPTPKGKKKIYEQKFNQLVKDMKCVVEMGKDPEYYSPQGRITVEARLAFCLKYIESIDAEGNFRFEEKVLNERLVETIVDVDVEKGSCAEKQSRGKWVGWKRLKGLESIADNETDVS